MSEESAGDPIQPSGHSAVVFPIAVAGAIVWGALVLGLYSISTAHPGLLIGWWIGQTVELAFAGGVLGAAANGVPLRRVWLLVGVAVVGLAAATVALQTLGLAPAMRVVP